MPDPTTLPAGTAHENVVRYFEKAGLDYQTWSRSFNMHFGYLRRGMNPFGLEAMLNEMNAQAMHRLQVEKMDAPLLLDLGCGLGTTSRFMARQLPTARFLGITITPWQRDFGNHLTLDAGLEKRIELHDADFQKMPLPDASADGAFALESACYATGNDKSAFLREAARALKPGARLVVVDGFRKHSRPLPGWLDRIYRRNLECWALTEFADIQLFTSAMEAAGFKNVVVEDVSWRVAPSFCFIPLTVVKFFWKRLFNPSREPLTVERRNNILAPILGMAMGLSRAHFTYCIVSGERVQGSGMKKNRRTT